MLRKAIYPKVESLLNKIATSLDKQGFTPNQLTLGGLVLNFVAGWIYATGSFFLAGIVLIAAAFGDLLDGPLARTSGKVSKFGAFLDSTVDRYSDFFLFGGLALYFAKEDEALGCLVVLGILMGGYVTSYAKARAENLIPNCSVGVFERAERVIALALASLLPFLMPLMLWVLLIGTNVTAIQRIIHTQKVLSKDAKKN